MLKMFNLMYYIAGCTDVGLLDTDRKDRAKLYELLRERKKEEAKPPKKE